MASPRLVWPPAGITLAAFVLAGVWLWPCVVAGASVPVGSGIAAGNTLEAILGVYVLRPKN